MKWFLILVSMLFCCTLRAAEESVLPGVIVIQQDVSDARITLQRYQATSEATLAAFELECGQLDQLGERLVEEKGLTAEKGKKAAMLRFQSQILFNAAMQQLSMAEMDVITAEGDVEILMGVVQIAKGLRSLNKAREVMSECMAELERLDKELSKKPRGVEA